MKKLSYSTKRLEKRMLKDLYPKKKVRKIKDVKPDVFWITKRGTLSIIADKIQRHGWMHISSSGVNEFRFKHRIFTGMLIKVSIDEISLDKILITCERIILNEPKPEIKVEELHYDPLKELKNGLYEYNIIIGRPLPGGSRNFSFDGTEKQFVEALEGFMVSHGWEEQDDKWFPGDPGDCEEPAYFICKTVDSITYNTALDFYNKILENII